MKLTCPHCQARNSIKDSLAGKTVRCGSCDGRIKVPAPAARHDDDDEYDRPRRRSYQQPSGSNVCGLLSVIFGAIGIVLVFIPCAWWGAVAVSVPGVLLGFIGLFFRPRATAVVGFILCTLSLVIPIALLAGLAASLDAVDRARQEQKAP